MGKQPKLYDHEAQYALARDAVPELLAALNQIAWLRCAGDVNTAKNATALVGEMERIALAAIAKATGAA